MDGWTIVMRLLGEVRKERTLDAYPRGSLAVAPGTSMGSPNQCNHSNWNDNEYYNGMTDDGDVVGSSGTGGAQNTLLTGRKRLGTGAQTPAATKRTCNSTCKSVPCICSLSGKIHRACRARLIGDAAQALFHWFMRALTGNHGCSWDNNGSGLRAATFPINRPGSP